MRNLIPLIKKELRRFFTDKRLLMSLILPGLMIFVMYTILGNVISSIYTLDENKTYEVYVQNLSDTYKQVFDLAFEGDEDNAGLKINYNYIEEGTLDTLKTQVTNGKIDLIIIFPDNFDDLLEPGFSHSSGSTIPQIEIYYNVDIVDSNVLYMTFLTLINELESQANNLFDVNEGDTQYNLSIKGEDLNPMAMMIPMLLLMFLVTGVVSVATESIAGEKERGTIATLLITPVSRFQLALSKIISVSIPSLLSAVVSFLGLYLSLPSLLQLTGENASLNLSFAEIGSLFAVMLVTVLMFAVLISIVSTIAKSVKESQQFTAPVILIASLSGIVTMFFTLPDTYLFFIPVVNSALSINSIFVGTFNITQMLITVGVNLVLIVGGVFLIGKMFNSEKIIFNK